MTPKGRVLMCWPEHYEVRYAINPWMTGPPVDSERAKRQYEQLVETYLGLGLEVHFLAQDPELPDMVFTANAGLGVGRRFIPSNFRYAERAPESAHFAAFFETMGAEVTWLDQSVVFEGAGDALYVGSELFLGHGFRSAKNAAQALAGLVEVPTVSLGLSNPYFYHLDTCLSPLPSGRFVYFPDAFEDRSRKLLEERGGYWVSERFCNGYGCNMVCVGETIVTSFVDQRMKEIAHLEEMELIELDVSEFMKSGGGVRCLTYLF